MRSVRINNITAWKVESKVSADGERYIYKLTLSANESVRGERQGKESLTKRP